MTSFFLIAFPLAALVNTVVALLVLLRGRTPVDGRRVALAAAAVLAANLAQIAALKPHGLHAFGVLHLAFLDLWVVVPLAGLALLVARARGRSATAAATTLAVLALPGLPIGLYAQLVEPYAVRLEQVTVPIAAARGGRDDLLVAVLADIQSTRIEPHQLAAVDDLMAHAPDLVLIPGDLYQGPGDECSTHLPGFQDLLSRLHAPGGVWVVPGNADVPSCLPRLLEGTGARLLRDEIVTVEVRDRRITILGLDEEPHEFDQLTRPAPPALTTFLDAPGDDLRILLCHRPAFVTDLPPDSRCDLVVAGHTHGGQVALPFFGPPITLSPLPRHVDAGGLHHLQGNALYVSRGLGMERLQAPRIRFLVPPEVTLLRFSSRAAASAP